MKLGMMIGEATPLSWERWSHLIALAERLGYASIWRSDHFFVGEHKETADVYLQFVVAAKESTTLRFGPMVTPVTFRPPVVVGRMAAQLDALSNGRFVMGLGVGWHDAEHEIFGLDFPPRKERYERLEEAIQLMQTLWRESPANYDGKYYQLRGAECIPTPPAGRPPIMIGGSGPDRTLRLVAQYADEWNGNNRTAEDYRELVGHLERHCDALGRDPATIKRSMFVMGLLGRDDQERQLLASRFSRMSLGREMSYEDLKSSARPPIFAESVEQCVDYCGQLAEFGVEEVIIEHLATDHDEIAEFIASDVMPKVKDL
jgi:alkanesulfonate monooxygenase SsuD/methylene tetrahydromethanopterin reductase-like flavin-dependent oxidoreductase (luciferase family)